MAHPTRGDLKRQAGQRRDDYPYWLHRRITMTPSVTARRLDDPRGHAGMEIQRNPSQGNARADASSPTSSATTPQEKVTSTTRATAHSTTARRSAPPSSAQASHRRRTRSRSARHAQEAPSPTTSERNYNTRMEKIRGNSNKSSLVTCLICNDSLLGDADQGDAIQCLTCTARFHSQCIYRWMEILRTPSRQGMSY